MSKAPTHTTTTDRYLQAIYCIEGERETARPGRLAYWLDVSAPTVSDALQRLKRDGWVSIAPDRSVTLTTRGNEVATQLIWRHRVLERWLTDVLNFDWATADEEADRISSAMSDAIVTQIDLSTGSPATCPHGNVIPGRKAPYGQLVALADLEPRTPATIRRISEVAEHEARMLLSTLAEHAIKEGSEVTVSRMNLEAHEVEVVVGGRPLTLTSDAAKLIWVEIN